MRIPGADQAIGHLIKWSEKDEWEPYRRQVFAEYFELIMERFDISEQEIVDLLDEAFGMVCGFVLEDFFTARFGEEGELNVVDNYLNRRGWREKVPAKRYLEALRDSVATLYEVVDLYPGHSMTVRDVILGGDPVSVEEKLGSQSAARWDRIAGRIVTVNGKRYFTGALRLFPHHVADEVLSAVDRMAKRLKGELRRNAKKQGEPAEINDHGVRQLLLSGSVARRLLTQTWLVDASTKLRRPNPKSVIPMARRSCSRRSGSQSSGTSRKLPPPLTVSIGSRGMTLANSAGHGTGRVRRRNGCHETGKRA